MLKFNRKALSLLLSLSMLAGSLVIGGASVMAASTNLPINYDFSTTGTDLTTQIITEKYEGRGSGDALEANDSSASIENGELKITFDNSSDGQQYNANYYNLRVKIPYSGLGADENLRISLETRDNDGTFNAKWQQFATLVNSNGNMVVWGRRDTDDNNRWGSGLGGLNQIMLVGYNAKASSYDTTIKPGSTGWSDGVKVDDLNTNYATKGAWAGGTIAGTDKHTICYEIERATDLVTVYVDGEVKGTFYILNELTESGYIDFRGWSNVAANETQYIDNVKIEGYKNVSAELPINYDFDTVVPQIGTENTNNLITAFGSKNKTSTTTIDNGQLKFYVANGDHGKTSAGDINAYNLSYYASYVKIPFTGLESGKNLKVSFKYTDGEHKTKWAEFGTLANADGKTIVGSRRDGEGTGRYGTEFGDRAQNLFYGYKTKATTYNTNATPSTVSAGANFGDIDTSNNGKNNNVGYAGSNSAKGEKHTVEYTIDADTDLVTIKYDNTEVGTFYAMNTLTSSGSLVFKAWAYTTDSDTIYIDDIKIEAEGDEAVTVPASTDIPINYDFSTTGTDLTTQIITEKFEGRQTDGVLETNDSAASIENGELKITFDNYSGGESYNSNYYNLRVKIPYSGLGADENLRISLETRDNDGTFDAVWQQFATLVNSNGNMVVWGRRDTWDNNRWSSGLGGRNQIMLIGYNAKASSYDTTAKPGSTAWNDGVQGGDVNTNYETKGAWAGGTIAGTDKHTICYEIERATDLVTVYVDGEVKGTFYILNELTESGYIDFRGWSNVAANETQYIDNVKIETYVKTADPVSETDIPLNYDFSEKIPTIGKESTNAFITSFGGSRNGYAVTNTTTIEDEAVKFVINDSDDPSVAAASNPDFNGINLNNYASGLKIPFTGLKDGENLRVSFKFKDTDGTFNAKWSDFGSLINSNGNTVLWSRRDSEGTGRFGTAWGANYQVMLVGYNKKVNTYDTTAKPGSVDWGGVTKAPDIEANYGSVGGFAGGNVKDSQWHTLSYEIDRATDAIVAKLDGEVIGSTMYAINEVTSSGYLWFKGWSGNGNNDEQWIDDVVIETWKPFVVESTNLTTDYDAKTDIALTFSNGLLSTGADVKAALTIKEKATGKVIENSRITVTIEDNVATVKVAGGLKYGKCAYVLTIAKDRIKDKTGILMATEYVNEFVTKLGGGVYIKEYTTPTKTEASYATTVTVKNPTASSQKLWLLLAVYDSTNNMIGIGTAKELDMKAGAETTFGLTADYDGTPNLVQLLLWNDPDELVPYHVPVVVE